MLHRERLRLSLEIELEANALIINSGAKAYSVARQRAEEAASDEMANDWNGVAAAISRRTRKETAPAHPRIPLVRLEPSRNASLCGL
jgi:hypothetical protein